MRPTRRRRCTRRCSPRAPRACCPASGGRRSCGRSTSTGRRAGGDPRRARRGPQRRPAHLRRRARRVARCCARSASAGSRSSASAAACGSPCPSRRWSRRTAAGPSATACRSRPRMERADLAAHRAWPRRTLMLRAGTGILRTQPPPDVRALARLRHQADALGVAWPAELSYAEFVRGLDPAVPAHAAVDARGDGGRPRRRLHGVRRRAARRRRATSRSPRPTPTRPRRCAACRTATSPSAAWPPAPASQPPDWVRAALPELPAAMTAGAQRAERGRARRRRPRRGAMLAGREGERFDAVVIDDGARAAARPGRPRARSGRRPAARAARSRCASSAPTRRPARCCS